MLASAGGAYALYRTAIADAGPLPLDSAKSVSVTVVDRDERLLRAFTTTEGKWRLPLDPKDVDPNYLKLLFAFEDRRFYEHHGVDTKAVARAVVQMVRHARLVSGGSTLTMQVARLLDGKHERTPFGKLRQMARAIELERTLSKTEILKLYLRLAPFGGNLEGVRAASLAYFGKEPRRLSFGEAALLVALPQSPELRRLDRYPDAARRARDRVLESAVAAHAITEAEAAKAKTERMPVTRYAFPMFAPHLTETEVKARPQDSIVKLTLDRNLQASLEKLAGEQARLIGDKVSAAIIVADHQTGEILAQVGSPGYMDRDRQGAVDMANAVRSPGSTLKPFIFGLAFESGLAHPETLIDDRPVRFGTYSPKNFDETYHGTVSVREALAQSLNIPAVRALSRVGPGKLAGRFRRAGVTARFPDKSEPTLAMALGGTGMTLLDLTQLYTSLARGGDSIELFHRTDARARVAAATRVKPLVNAHRLMSPLAAWYVTDILKDAPPPQSAKGGRFAYKTGTSYGYRDAWAIGYDGRYVVAAWVGRPDNSSVPGILGRTAAAPILFDAFQRVSAKRSPLRSAPATALLVKNADLPAPLKRWRDPGDDPASGRYLEPPVLISFPPDQSEIEAAEHSEDPLVLKADGGALPLTWLIDGVPIASDAHSREADWQPGGAGFAKLTVIDANGRTDRVSVRLR
ncbi:penicillin-binding protein 1C [Hyphomicrobium methylovorum]|uniref:penicillin-binding protein 1C n=1 Tax=Hyphomicrobium methylovorum TaxID=84 RepID=UPI0015E73FD2|nr:penicillin-binding protein 1C [Hyphomicrobium methylovorum]MBA2126469.1 penicillin-binding protein 1C [Hyphomicrobium methylovorum]